MKNLGAVPIGAPSTAMRLRSFDPIVSGASRVLILGSMPGDASLRAREYYARPGNAFWPIMGALFGADPSLPYDQRLRRLDAAGIALWDVLYTCTRIGSLDSAIRDEAPNDFDALFTAYPAITQVFFNGAKAESAFERHVSRGRSMPRLVLVRLPSTSPAHARMTLAAKIDAWRVVAAGAQPARF